MGMKLTSQNIIDIQRKENIFEIQWRNLQLLHDRMTSRMRNSSQIKVFLYTKNLKSPQCLVTLFQTAKKMPQ